jgi:hypothetical protein
MLVVEYPLERFDFRPWARSVLGVDRLEDLHLKPDPLPFGNYVERLNHYCGLLKQRFPEVTDRYFGLIEFLGPLFGGLDVSQNPPSFRCHLVGGRTASSFHRDGEPKYGLRPGTLNAWVPLTEVYGSNSLMVESVPGAADYQPLELRPGHLVLFDAYHLTHGSCRNETRSSRVSFDFRFLPKDRERGRRLDISTDSSARRPPP